MKKVQILMSTYNGVEYLRVQLESIVQQSYSELELLIRDDGSTDGTQRILEEYATKYSWIHWYQGENIGVQKSFFHLIQHADPSASYFSFADQDDKWLRAKLERAVSVLQRLEKNKPTIPNQFSDSKILSSSIQKPVLYCSDKYIVDENLNPISVTVSRRVRKISFGNALVQNMCTGCTAVMNRKLLEIIRTHMPHNIDAVIMHDWWFYLVATCFGTVYYDKIPYILYRQHGKNTSGAMLNQRELMKYRLHQLSKSRGNIYQQLKEFGNSFVLPDLKGQMLNQVLASNHSSFDKIKLMMNRNIFRQKINDDIIYRIIVLIGKL